MMVDMTKRTLIVAAAATVAVAAGAITFTTVRAASDDDDEVEVPIGGADLERASAAALAATGGGRVTETEVGDEESYYEVEVTLDDGRQVDVQLDEQFAVVSADADREEPGDTD
jgi:uncharacterized membrane protein YkoI